MGNSASSAGRTQQEETVDYGFLQPQGVYTGPRDWNQSIVTQLILDRRLAPFYRPLEEYDESWDDEQILAARKELSEHDVATSDSSGRIDSSNVSRSSSFGNAARRSPTVREFGRIPEAVVYRGAVECPICFLVRTRLICDMFPIFIDYVTRRPRSITLQISTIRGVVTRLFARNALCR